MWHSKVFFPFFRNSWNHSIILNYDVVLPREEVVSTCFPSSNFEFWSQSSCAVTASSLQKQPLEVFCKKRCSHRKTPVPESLFKKICRPRARACNFIKKETLAQVFSGEFCEISKNTFSYRTCLNVCFCLYQPLSRKHHC